jgi:hypothetical protein
MHAHDKTESLYAIVRSIEAGRPAEAEQSLRRLMSEVDATAEPRDLKYLVFGGALSRRLGESSFADANLYLSDFEVPQIHLFNVLGAHFHPVGLATQALNGAIAELLDGVDEPTVIDVGIGTGRQMTLLLESLAKAARPPRRLMVVGIEPSRWALDLAGENLARASASLGIEVDFRPIHNVLEALTLAEWQDLRHLARGAVINASFALHHIRNQPGSDLRTGCLRRLAALGPRAVLLAEPNSNHHEVALSRRFHNCFQHFGQVFQLVDELPIEPRDRDALKVCFFGREIVDILGHDDSGRTERHEDQHAWMVRLRDAGFRLLSSGQLADGLEAGPVAVRPHDGYLGVDFAGETMVAILCAEPQADAPSLEALESLYPQGAVPDASRAPSANPKRDSMIYFAAMIAIARADGVLHDTERGFIERQARILGVDTAPLWEDQTSLEDLIAAHGDVPVLTRQAIVRDAVLLAQLDGHYSDEERAKAESVCRVLGLDVAIVRKIEARFRDYVPQAFEHAPSWFVEQWLMGMF